MLSRLREQLGTAGLIVACVALVAALGGSALAAKTALTGKQKKQVQQIAKTEAKKWSKRSAKAGPQGPAGPAGSNGKDGSNGSNGKDGVNGKDGLNGLNGKPGTDGANGESVNIVPLAAENGSGHCEAGGAEFFNAESTAYACNGEDGEDGEGGEGGGEGGGSYPETLPSGRMMTGYWEVLGDAAVHFGPEWAATSVGFPLPLASAPTKTLLVDPSSTPPEEEQEELEENCPGGAENPEPAPGVLCLYLIAGSATLEFGGASTTGGLLAFGTTDRGLGLWAVKAP